MPLDLSTRYLGLELANPIVASSGPYTADLKSLQALERAGAAAVVLPSLFEEQIKHEELEVARLHEFHSESYAESLTYFPELDDYNTGPDDYLERIRQAKQKLSIPVIASLNGVTPGGWVRYGRLIQEAGADALELNVFLMPTDPRVSPTDVTSTCGELVRAVRAELSIPVAVKIGPYFSSLAYEAARLAEAGADGLVLFNRFLAPDIDLKRLRFVPEVELSRADELRLVLRWIAILRDQIGLSLAATGGIHQPEDVVKALLVGADVVTVTSTLLTHGIYYAGVLRRGLAGWMIEHEYDSVEQMKGSMSQSRCPNPDALQRANYMRTLASYTPK